MSSTVVSWALTLSLLGVAVYYYKPDLFKSLISSSSEQSSPSPSEPIKGPANKRTKSKKSLVSSVTSQNDELVPSSSNEAKVGKKRKIVPPPGPDDATRSEAALGSGTTPGRKDAGLGDKEFAQQLARTQAGTNLQKSGGQKSQKKSKSLKQSQAASLESSGISTATSSTTGRDADDDLTPAESPLVQPKNGPTQAGDISDMMEAPAAKQVVLRLSNISDEPKPKKKIGSQPFEQVLTKKQRQAQAKKEELRLMKEESDRIHEAKKQEQLRKARMASGTSNQTKANNFTHTASNAWQSGKGNATVKAAPVNVVAPLLDTFEPSMNNVSQPNGAVKTIQPQSASSAKASALTGSTREGGQHTDRVLSGSISEEEQMQMLKEQQAEDAWESVTSKKSKKKTSNDVDEPSVTQYQTSTVPRHQPNGPKSTSKSTRPEPETNNRFGSFQVSQPSNFADAEWEA